MKRLTYLIYYLSKLDRRLFLKFLIFTRNNSNKNRATILVDVIYSCLRYNISLLDYFYFRFYDKTVEERRKWAGTGYLYEYQLYMNPKKTRFILENKIEFLKNYTPYIKRHFSDIQGLFNNPSIVSSLLKNESGKIVLKLSNGQVGKEVQVFQSELFTKDSLYHFMLKNNFDLVEEFVVQHPDLMALSPSGLNTVRIFTQLDKDKVVLLGARLRISVNSEVDNLGAGNIAAPIDIKTGIVNGPAIYSDITREEVATHPVTNQPINGFQVPYWNETLNMIKEAALLHPENKSIGWDIAIRPDGPELIEGNHNWCKLLWQLPVKQGLKHLIEKY